MSLTGCILRGRWRRKKEDNDDDQGEDEGERIAAKGRPIYSLRANLSEPLSFYSTMFSSYGREKKSIWCSIKRCVIALMMKVAREKNVAE